MLVEAKFLIFDVRKSDSTTGYGQEYYLGNKIKRKNSDGQQSKNIREVEKLGRCCKVKWEEIEGTRGTTKSNHY